VRCESVEVQRVHHAVKVEIAVSPRLAGLVEVGCQQVEIAGINAVIEIGVAR
jgi:hypothetical protein